MDRYKKNPLCLGALDIGGTKISIGIADESGRIIASEKIKTEKDPEAAMKTAAEYLKNMSELRSCKLEAVGVSCAGPVDTVTGKVNNPYTLPGWEEYPLTERLSELSGVAVKLENDANCALLGEVQLSGLRKNRVLMISIGTGIGCAFWDGRSFYRTGKKYHPELGHVLIGTNRTPSEKCYCGHYNCVENLLSGTALHKRAQDAGFRDFGDLTEAYFSAFHRQKPAAELFIRDIKAEFYSALWNYSLVFHPDNIVLGGGMAFAYYSFFEDICRDFLESVADREDFIPPFKLSCAGDGEATALAGAAMLWRI